MTESTLPRQQTPAVDAPAIPARRVSTRASLQAGYLWRATQLVADVTTVFVAATATYLAYLESGLGRSHYDPGRYLRIMAELAVIVVFGQYGLGAYRGQLGLLQIESVRRMIKSVFLGVMLVFTFSFFLQTGGSFSRLTMLAVGPVVVMALIAQRWLLWKLARRLRAARGGEAPVLVYGAGEVGLRRTLRLMKLHTSLPASRDSPGPCAIRPSCRKPESNLLTTLSKTRWWLKLELMPGSTIINLAADCSTASALRF